MSKTARRIARSNRSSSVFVVSGHECRAPGVALGGRQFLGEISRVHTHDGNRSTTPFCSSPYLLFLFSFIFILLLLSPHSGYLERCARHTRSKIPARASAGGKFRQIQSLRPRRKPTWGLRVSDRYWGTLLHCSSSLIHFFHE
jgi:hypothetical protein